MISVGSSDGRKRSGLGLEMEETELEEGEAPSYHDEAEDSTIDPDIDLSYIEEKLQNVLGHFQKDFEGGVSAENLGAKFGGYGSFLPTYQRSPSWSHTRSPAQVQNYDLPRSPRKLHLEDQRQYSFASTSASPSARSRDTSGQDVPVGNSLKGKGYLQSKHAEESSLKRGAIKNPSDQRTLKVRIKVGSENLSTQKNAEIYSGLGLVVSPSSSLDESPTTSVGLCGKLPSVPEESPTSILQIMTSYPGKLLLSPLPDDLVYLTEKRKPRGKCENERMDKTSIESSGLSVNGSHSRSNQKVKEPKKLKSHGKDGTFSVELTNQKNSGDNNNTVSLIKKNKEDDIDTSRCEELVSNALKLPLLLSSQHGVADPAKDVPTAATVPLNALEDAVKGEILSASMEKEHLDSESAHKIGRFEKLGGSLGSSGKDSGSKKANIVSNIAAAEKSHTVDCSESNVTKGRRDLIAAAPEGEKSRALDHSVSHASKGRKALTAAEPTEPTKQFLKGGYFSEEGLKPDLEKLSTGGKRKQKLSQSISTQGLYVEKDELMVESSLTHKGGKNSHINDLLPKTDPYDLQKDREKPGDRYKDFFGDLEFDDEDNESISGEMIPSEWLKDPQFIVKRSLSEDRNTPKDKWNSKSSEKPLPPETHPSLAPHLAPPLGNGPCSEAPTGLAPLVNEDWVLCDKCQKWRLLPLGTNPKSLPDKWICRMLNWLPGMNRCSIPEEETTSALRALYHPAALVPAPASESQCVGVNTAAVNSVDAKYPNPDHRSIAVQTATINGKKKHGSTKATNSTELDGSTHSSNSRKKNLVASGKISNLNSEVHPPSLDACGYQQMQQSSAAVEKYNNVEEEKISLVKCSGKDANLKIKSKREAGVEGSRAYKRKKTEESHFEDENWTSDNGGTSSKVGRGSTSLSNNTSGNDLRKYINNKDLSGEAKKNAVSGIGAEKHVSGTSDGLLSSGKCDKDSVRKRKFKKPHGSQIRTEPTLSSVRHPDCGDFIEEKCESDHWKEKKARVSNSGGKDTSGSKTSVGTNRKSKDTKDLHNKQFVRNKQAAVYIKSDMGTEQPLVAANSSSSKVSGSHENKTSGQEIKGSPVESVSSSPFKSTNADKVMSTRTNLNEKDDFHDYGFMTAVSPRRLSCGEDGGGDRTEMVKKDRILSDQIEMVQKERILNIDGHVTADGNNDQLCQINQYGSVKHSSDKSTVEEKTNASESQNSDFHVKKSAKVLSFLSKDRAHATGSHLDKVNIKVSDSSHDSLDRVHLYEEKSKSRRSKSDEKSGNPCKGEKFICKKDTAGGTSSENSRGQIQKKFVHDGQDAGKSWDKKHNIQQDSNNEKLPKKGNPAEAYGSGKSNSLPPLARVQTETVATPQPVSGSHTETDVKTMAIDPFDDADALRVPNRRKRTENPSGQPARNPIPNSHKVRDVEASSPLRRDSSSQAANSALKEAKDLKHLADRHKNSGSTDSIRFYFEAVLKFLHAASLLESGSNEPTKHNELMHSMHIYSSTAKLCEFCAHEYEKSKDMAAAALAYKCVEVAYMRVVYSSHTSASRDWKELQKALQIVPSGESPSSSASDVDNLNHQATTDKVAPAKVVSSPQVSGGHFITSRNRSGFLRILDFAQDVNFAMEASRKSRIAFTAATSGLGETSLEEGISSLKKALDFNFQDVESLLHLVRVAMEAINR